MSNLFNYSVDGDTMRECLAMVGRAFDRMAQGEPVFVNETRARATPVLVPSWIIRCKGLSPEQRADIQARWDRAQSAKHIAGAVGCGLSTVYAVVGTRRKGRAS